MKNLLLCSDIKAVSRVYTGTVTDVLFGTEDPLSVLRTKEAVLEHPDRYRDTEFLFSTWGMPPFTVEEIRTVFPALRAVFYAAGTVQSFARPFLACGVRVFSAWQANAVPVAQYTAAQILLANKGFFACSELTKRCGWNAGRERLAAFPGNFETKIGIIGYGSIGKLVHEYLRPFGLTVLVFSQSLTEETATELGAEKCDIETIFRSCGVVSNHLADNENTRHIFKKEHFASMLPNAVFLNTGRGAQLDEGELTEVLRERLDLTAVLDVTDPEPPEASSLLYRLPNVVLTPHIAGSNGNEVHRMAQYMYEEYSRFCRGDELRYEVTPDMLNRMA